MKLKVPPIPVEWARRVAVLKAIDQLRAQRQRLREEMTKAADAYKQVVSEYLGREASLGDLRALEKEYDQLSVQVQAWKKERWPGVVASLQTQLAEKRASETPPQRRIREAYDPTKEAAEREAARSHYEAMEMSRAWIAKNERRQRDE